MKKGKKCDMSKDCWSGFTGILGAAFIIVATILTLITMNGLGILGMFFVGLMLCKHHCIPCHTYHHEHGDMCCDVDDEGVQKPKKNTVKK